MEVPLKIHSLSRLAERTGLDKQLSEEQLDFIDKLEPLNIEARYPSYKERLMKSLTKEYCAELLSDIDIAVIVERLDDDYFKDTPLLWKLRRKISNLIEPVLLTEDMDNPLYCDIRKTGILIQ